MKLLFLKLGGIGSALLLVVFWYPLFHSTEKPVSKIHQKQKQFVVICCLLEVLWIG